MSFDQSNQERAVLHTAIRENLPHLEDVLSKVQSHWGAEDLFYRFYHQSSKVYHCKDETVVIVRELHALAPERPLHPWFMAIVEDAVGRSFSDDVNPRWLEEVRPVLEAFLHAKMFLELVVQTGRNEPQQPKRALPRGWAAVLCPYQLRY